MVQELERPRNLNSGNNQSHVLESQQFTRKFLVDRLFPEAEHMERVAVKGGNKSLRGRSSYNLFYEPSTRTRVSFETAMDLLGGRSRSTENAGTFSSAVKGESIEHTARILEGYHYDIIVVRHSENGSAERAANAVRRASVINAGDGTGQHPTQALLDIGSIQRFLGGVEGARIAIAGDLEHGRTANSLAYLLAKFKGVKLDFVAPEGYGIQDGIRDYLQRHQVEFTEDRPLKEVVGDADVVYMTRPQLERHNGHPTNDDQVVNGEVRWNPDFDDLILDKSAMTGLRRNAIVMHPMPSTQEMAGDIWDDRRVIPFLQAQYGLYIRMALLKMIADR